MVEETYELGDEILKVEDVAAFLRVSEATVYRMAKEGELPAKRVGRSWRFSRVQIQEWFKTGSSEYE